MDKLNLGLNPQSKEAYHPAIKVAMQLAHTKMNHYYSITNNSSAYRIAMGVSFSFLILQDWADWSICNPVLHPGLKLEYFCIQDWEDEWIEVAEHLVCDEYIDAYDNCATVGDPLNDNNEVITLYLWHFEA